MNSTITFFLLDLYLGHHPYPPMSPGHANLLSNLKQYLSIETISSRYDVRSDQSYSIQEIVQDLLEKRNLAQNSTFVVGIGVYVWNVTLVKSLLRKLRDEGFKERIILGGPTITYAGKDQLERLFPEADIFIRGYAEEALPNVILSKGKISESGVHYAHDEDKRDFAVPSTDNLLSPHLTGVTPLVAGRGVWLETQRGCPFKCSFCQYSGIEKKRNLQEIPWKRLKAELELFQAIGIQRIKIVDPIFNHGSNFIQILYHLHNIGYRDNISVECRFELVKKEFIKACNGLNITLEFGLQTIVKEEMETINRRNNLEKVREVIRWVQDAKVDYLVTIMYGLPHQTIESFLKTVNFLRELNVKSIVPCPLALYDGTLLSNSQDSKEMITTKRGYLPIVIKGQSFTKSDWRVMNTIKKRIVQKLK